VAANRSPPPQEPPEGGTTNSQPGCGFVRVPPDISALGEGTPPAGSAPTMFLTIIAARYYYPTALDSDRRSARLCLVCLVNAPDTRQKPCTPGLSSARIIVARHY